MRAGRASAGGEAVPARRLVDSICPSWATLTCVLLLAACPSTPPPPAPTWNLVFNELPNALLSVTGTSDADVWAVGSDASDGTGPLALHFDGKEWKRHRTGTTGDLWWVHTFESGPVFLGGANGTVLRFENGAIAPQSTPPETTTVYGIWGATPDDVWAVGGDGESHGFIWHFDGQHWTIPAGLPSDLATKTTIYKVWGSSKDDVWFVGSGTRVIHWDGSAFSDSATNLASSERPLFTVTGSSQLVVAVGGFASGFLMEHSATGWQDHSPTGVQTLSGVFLRDSIGYAVGARGTVVHRGETTWERESLGLTLRDDLHSVWISPNGIIWAVGGRILQPPLGNGVMLVKGSSVPGGSFTDE